MESFISGAFLLSLFIAAIRMSIPLTFGMMGELINEKSGVMNLGIEGIMTLGAFVAFIVTYYTQNVFLGVLCAGIAGSLVSILMAFLTVTLCLDQVVVGLGLGFSCTGLSNFLYRHIIGAPSVVPTIEKAAVLKIPLLSKIPFIGPILFQQNVLFYVGITLVIVFAFIINRTSWGLSMRTVGQVPKAADTIGVNVARIRYISLMIGGFLMAIGGAYLSTGQSNMYVSGIVAGRGWISIALVVFGGYYFKRCYLGALLFGFVDAFQLRLQTVGLPIPYQIPTMLPYLTTLIVLVFVSHKAIYPAALKKAYRREE